MCFEIEFKILRLDYGSYFFANSISGGRKNLYEFTARVGHHEQWVPPTDTWLRPSAHHTCMGEEQSLWIYSEVTLSTSYSSLATPHGTPHLRWISQTVNLWLLAVDFSQSRSFLRSCLSTTTGIGSGFLSRRWEGGAYESIFFLSLFITHLFDPFCDIKPSWRHFSAFSECFFKKYNKLHIFY